MSKAVFQPVGQKRLTNIAVVRLKKNGKRFEIACYRNKVGDWRSGIEKDLDEVLQTTTIFANVGKGVMANKEDLVAAFGTADEEKISLEILARGELQVSDGERKMQLDNLFKDVVSVLVEKTVNPDTGRPYTINMLERALRDIHFNPDPKRSAKQQALEALPLLKERISIERARMRLKLQVPTQYRQQLLDELQSQAASIETRDEGLATCSYTVQVDPGSFRPLHQFVQDATDRQGRVEVLAFAVQGGNAAAEDFETYTSAAHAPAAAPAAPQQATTSGRDGLPTPAAAAAAAVPKAPHPLNPASTAAPAPSESEVLYTRGPVSLLPDEYASRRDRFSELDGLQPGWEVELRQRGSTVDAIFFCPAGQRVGPYANARRQALQAAKQQAG